MLIILLGFFFRTYTLEDRFEFAHDGDLYSWIVKDIIVDKNIRLIGQETSASGIFIGSLFYYLIAPFYPLTNMDPIAVYIPITLISLLTIFSYYFCLSKLFNKYVGLIASFLQAILLWPVGFDRWVVPTNLTKIWAVWYLFTVISIGRGNYQVLPILGILIGLIWHVHIALVPTLIAIPLAFFFSKKIPSPKQLLLFFSLFIITSAPLLVFEIKHHFSQIFSLLNNFNIDREGPEGFYKLERIFQMISQNTSSLLLYPFVPPKILQTLLTLALLLSGIFLFKKKIIKKEELLILYSWILGIILFFTFSSSQISEYYFSNLEVIFITLISLLLFTITKITSNGRYIIAIVLFLLLLINLLNFLKIEPSSAGYKQRKAVAEFITNDSREKKFPCVGINYITRLGENVGFRYFFYLNNLKLAPPSNKVPVYSIVYPSSWSEKEVTQKFGFIGVIPPTKIPPKESLEYDCSGANTNLTDPFFGFIK